MKRLLVFCVGFLLLNGMFFVPQAGAKSLRPLDCTGYQSCDGQYYDRTTCVNGGAVDIQDDQVYVGTHHAGVLHLYSDTLCHTMHVGFRVDNGVCIWNPGSAMGQYNTIEVDVAPEPNQSPICGAWWSSGMDEKENYDGDGNCESGWVFGNTGWNNATLSHKLINPSGQGC